MHTKLLAELSVQFEVKQLMLVSSDKAVRPTNVMGATKRLAELILQSYSDKYGEITCFSMVRFGNVFGSSGSVIPRFAKQIETGGPLTITDKQMTRYFMSISEASQLVLHASDLSTGGEVFHLDMGETININDIAEKMISISENNKVTANPMGI